MAFDGGSSSTSPDPLAISPQEQLHHSIKPKRAISTTPKKALRDIHDNVTLQDFYLTTPSARVIRSSSPSKSVAQTENLVSPWRIRVRVEAERDEGGEDAISPSGSPSKARAHRTTTTIVPLKGADDPSPAFSTRGRGRPRKSPNNRVKRKGTPRPAKAVKRKIHGETPEDEGFSDIGVTPPRKAKGRPKKNSGPEVTHPKGYDDETIRVADSPASAKKIKNATTSSPSQRKGKSRTKAAAPTQVATESGAVEIADEIPNNIEKGRKTLNPANHTLHQVRSTQTRSTPGHKRIARNRESTDHDVVPNLEVKETSNYFASPSPSQVPPTIADQDRPREDVETQENRGHPIGDHPDPTEVHHEYDSIIESEGFSMISVSTLPSAKQLLSDSSMAKPRSIDIAKTSELGLTKPKSQAIQLTLPITTETAAKSALTQEPETTSSTVAVLHHGSVTDSSVDSKRQLSPPIMRSMISMRHEPHGQATSTDLSSLLLRQSESVSQRRSPRSYDKPKDATPRLARIVQAGIALPGALEPKSQSSSIQSHKRRRTDSPPSAELSKERPDNIFSGFGNGTRRELRAGLRLGERLGEELAKERPNDLFSGFGNRTRRELRAGLRLGEELAKRQKVAIDAAAIDQRTQDNLFPDKHMLNQLKLPTPDEPEAYTPSLPQDQGQVEYPKLPTRQLPSPERSEIDIYEDQMSWRVDVPVNGANHADVHTSHISSGGKVRHEVDKAMLRREEEWQREREAVSRQIQEANISQVVVIDDTIMQEGDEEDDEDDIDVWQNEANSSNQNARASPEVPELFFSNRPIKPRRSKLPSPWRKSSSIVYSDEVVSSDEDPFGQSEVMRSRSLMTPKALQSVRPDFSDFSVLSRFSGFEPNDESSPLDSIKIRHRYSDRETPVVSDQRGGEIGIERSQLTVQNEVGHISEDRTEAQEEHHRHATESPQPAADIIVNSQQGPCLPTNTSTSWYSCITNFIPGLRAFLPAKVFQPPTTNPPSQNSNIPHNTFSSTPQPAQPHSPLLSIYAPWTTAHYLHLHPFYLAAKNNPSTHPFNPSSPSASLLGCIVYSRGWEKEVEEWELGVVDEYLQHLGREGVDDMVEGEEKVLIGEVEVVKRVFSLWVGGVVRGECGVGGGRRGEWDVRWGIEVG